MRELRDIIMRKRVNDEKIGDYMNSREDWLRVELADGADGGYDVVLRIDGAYHDREDAVRIAWWHATQLKRTGLNVELREAWETADAQQ